MAGYSSEVSAKIIGISGPALRLHLTSIYDKLGVSNKLELTLFAVYYQLIDKCEVSPPCDRKSLLPAEQPGSEEGHLVAVVSPPSSKSHSRNFAVAHYAPVRSRVTALCLPIAGGGSV